MAEYEVQSWPGWHRHMALSLLAAFFLTKETLRSKKSPSLTVPMGGLLMGEQLRRYATRTCPDWMDWTVEQKSLHRELAYFYHYKARGLLSPRRMNRRL